MSVVATWPVVLSCSTSALGELYTDRAQNIWNAWWVKFSLLDLYANPFETRHLLYPGGTDLYFHALNLPSGIISLPISLGFGPVAAYNFTALLGLTLSGYAGFRLVLYLRDDYRVALLGGLIIGFNPLSLWMLRGQINIVNLQWFLLAIEFYLRAWSSRKRSDAIVVGIFFSLALLTVGYFEVLLLVFFAIHLMWALLSGSHGGLKAQLVVWGKHVAHVAAWSGGTAILLLAPYLLGAWQSAQRGQVLVKSGLDDARAVSHSADLVSFILPNRDHWLLGEHAPWREALGNNVPDFTYLSLVTLGLTMLAVWVGRRQAVTWLWVTLGLTGALLALGPILQVNGQQNVGGVRVPMPFQLLQALPPVSLVRAPERFIFLTYISLGALASGGIIALGKVNRRGVLLAGLGALLLLEMPLHTRYVDPMPIPLSVAVLKSDLAPGAVLELPMTHHGRIEARQMYYQTTHGRPITSAYLSRITLDPYIQTCSPLKVFRSYPDIEINDIISPTTATKLSPGLLAANGFGFILVYKEAFGESDALSPVPEGELSTLQDLASRLGAPIADDEVATAYKVNTSQGLTSVLLQLGDGWHSLEESQGKPFRWINGKEADMCLFSPQPASSNPIRVDKREGSNTQEAKQQSLQDPFTASLIVRATSFNTPRHLQVWVGDSKVLEVEVPGDGALHSYSTSDVTWASAPQLVRFVVPEGSDSPAFVHQGDPDHRQISIGFETIDVRESKR
ncbi:MAG: hypothetical protein ABIO92_08140 [Chloroflexia bacterium]